MLRKLDCNFIVKEREKEEKRGKERERESINERVCVCMRGTCESSLSDVDMDFPSDCVRVSMFV